MSRFSFFGIGLALGLFLLFWSFFGIVIYIGYGAYGFGVDVYVVIWAVIFLGAIWGIFAAFRRALRPLPQTLDMPDNSDSRMGAVSPKSESLPEKSADQTMENANKKLAALLGNPNDPKGT